MCLVKDPLVLFSKQHLDQGQGPKNPEHLRCHVLRFEVNLPDCQLQGHPSSQEDFQIQDGKCQRGVCMLVAFFAFCVALVSLLSCSAARL